MGCLRCFASVLTQNTSDCSQAVKASIGKGNRVILPSTNSQHFSPLKETNQILVPHCAVRGHRSLTSRGAAANHRPPWSLLWGQFISLCWRLPAPPLTGRAQSFPSWTATVCVSSHKAVVWSTPARPTCPFHYLVATEQCHCNDGTCHAVIHNPLRNSAKKWKFWVELHGVRLQGGWNKTTSLSARPLLI